MAQKDKKNIQAAETATRSEALLDRALLISGAKIPTTPEEVAIVEGVCSEEVRLPPHLKDAAGFVSFKRGERSPTRRPGYDERTTIELARVAREGAAITPDIEARMKAAREDADHEREDD